MMEDQGINLRRLLTSKDSFKEAYLVRECAAQLITCIYMYMHCLSLYIDYTLTNTKHVYMYMYIEYTLFMPFTLSDAGGDGDWSFQTCWTETHGLQSGN